MKTFLSPLGFSRTFEVEARPDGPLPVVLTVPSVGDDRIPLTRAEAEALRDNLTKALEYDPTAYVQVKVQGHSSRTYTYRDPSAELRVGDFVQVPFGYQNRLKLAEVTALGRGTFRGAVKDVAARFLTEPLAA